MRAKKGTEKIYITYEKVPEAKHPRGFIGLEIEKCDISQSFFEINFFCFNAVGLIFLIFSAIELVIREFEDFFRNNGNFRCKNSKFFRQFPKKSKSFAKSFPGFFELDSLHPGSCHFLPTQWRFPV